LIEYGDYECPACGEYEPIVQQIYKTYSDRVLFVFRDFPLYQIHPFAMISAQATDAADLQGKYWEMHDLLYSKQSEWSTNSSLSPSDVVSKYFNGYAQSLGLDVAKFGTDINSDAVKARVQSDLALGNAAQIDHTPTFFINNVQVANPQSQADFQKDLDAALASSTSPSVSATSTTK
jgi:protein-disulfide isomerase